MRKQQLFHIILPFIVISLLCSFILYGLQGYPLKNFLWATVMNLGVYLFYGIVISFLILQFPKDNIRAFLLTLFTTIPLILSFVSIVAKVSWGQFITFSILRDVITNYTDFIMFSPINPYFAALIFIVFNIFLFRYFLLVIVKSNSKSYSKNHLTLITSAILIFLLSNLISSRIRLAVSNHIVFNDHLTSILANSINGGIKLANNKSDYNSIKNSNIEEYNLKFQKDNLNPKNKKNIVLIVVDALRADKIGAYMGGIPLTPFIDSIAKSNTFISINNSFSTCGNSACGILSLLASKQWKELGLFNYLLQDHLKKAGYKNHFFLSGLHSSWYNIGKQYMSNVDVYYEGKDSETIPIGDDQLIIEALDKYLPETDTLSFFYLHLMSTHFFGKVNTQYQRFYPIKSNPFDSKEEKLQAYINSYNNGVIQADAIIKQVFERLKKYNLLEKSIVIITADHGETLGEDGLVGHSESLTKKEIEIPFLIYGIESNMIKNNGTHSALIDISPTILDLIDVPVPDTWQGKSVLKKQEFHLSYHNESDYRAVIFSNDNYIIKKEYNIHIKTTSYFNIKSNEKEMFASEIPDSILSIIEPIQL